MDHGLTKKRWGPIFTLNTHYILQERAWLLILPNEKFYRKNVPATYNKTQAPTTTLYMGIILLADQF